MQLRFLFLLSIAIFAFSSCDNDDDSQLIVDGNIIHYDGANFSGPNLEAGDHELAVRFKAKDLEEFQGNKIVDITFYMGLLPAGCLVKIYGAGSDNTPGNLLYEADVATTLQAPQWNTHVLSEDINLDGGDIWISIALRHNISQQSLGCDEGPAADTGDLTLLDGSNTWRTYRDLTPESVNWNIRMKIGE